MNTVSKADHNQREIVEALRKAGATVLHLHTVGRGCPDILAGYDGEDYLIEIKMPGGVLTPDQAEFFRTWQGHAYVVRSADEALRLIGVKA